MTEFKPQNAELKTINRFESPYSKIVSETQAIAKSRIWQKQGYVVVVIDVVCDLFQVKHCEYFQAVANQGDKVIVRVVRHTGKHPDGSIIPSEQRAQTLAHMPYIDLITGMDDGQGLEWIDQYKPSVVIKSTTSGAKVASQIKDIADLKHQPKVIVFDENCVLVPLDQAEAKGKEYDDTKFRADRVSGSMIKQEIVNRFLKDQQGNLQCDLPTLLRNNI